MHHKRKPHGVKGGKPDGLMRVTGSTYSMDWMEGS